MQRRSSQNSERRCNAEKPTPQEDPPASQQQHQQTADIHTSTQSLANIHEQYDQVLQTMKENRCSMACAFRLAGCPRSTLRDFMTIAELKKRSTQGNWTSYSTTKKLNRCEIWRLGFLGALLHNYHWFNPFSKIFYLGLACINFNRIETINHHTHVQW